jgi:excisionase family DNA binding protein
MELNGANDYLSVEEAAAFLRVPQPYLRRVLREYGLGELLRASMSKQVKIRRADLEKLHIDRRETAARRQAPAAHEPPAHRGAA